MIEKAILTSPSSDQVKTNMNHGDVLSLGEFQGKLWSLPQWEVREFADKSGYEQELIVQASALVRDWSGKVMAVLRAQDEWRITRGSSILISGNHGTRIEDILSDKLNMPEGVKITNQGEKWIGYSGVNWWYLFMVFDILLGGDSVGDVSSKDGDKVLGWFKPDEVAAGLGDKKVEQTLIEKIRV